MVEETQALNWMRDDVMGHGEDGEMEITDARQIPNHCRVRATGKRFLADGRVLERFWLGWRGSLKEALENREEERWVELSVVA